MSKSNLKPQSERTKEEQRVIAKMGGIASGKARRLKKHGRELMRDILALKEVNPQTIAEFEAEGIDPRDLTKEVVANLVQLKKAIEKEDTAAFRAVHDLAGHFDEKVDAQTHVTINISQLAADAGKKWSAQE